MLSQRSAIARSKAFVLPLLYALFCPQVSADLVVDGNTAWLELPQQAMRIAGGSSASLSARPEEVQQAILHLPQGGSHVSYGKLHTRINTEPSDVAMKSMTVSEGLVLRLDLTAGGGFHFKAGRNSVELEYQDRFGRSQYFNFLINFAGVSTPTNNIAQNPATPAPATEVRPGRPFAVVIGISQYAPDPTGHIKSLKYADKDALAFADFLRSPAGGSIDHANLKVLLNREATAQNVRHALFTFLTQAQPDDTVIIFIAGHGAQDPLEPRNLYLLTTDTDPFDMGGTAFPMWQMQDVFSRIVKAHRVITLADTCHSFGFSGEDVTTTKKQSSNLFNQYLTRYAADQDRAVITASDISEQSYEDARFGGGHGVFTYYLLRGLAGEADGNHDGRVTAGEIFAYLQKVIPSATEGLQNPRAMAGLDSALVMSNVPNRSPR